MKMGLLLAHMAWLPRDYQKLWMKHTTCWHVKANKGVLLLYEGTVKLLHKPILRRRNWCSWFCGQVWGRSSYSIFNHPFIIANLALPDQGNLETENHVRGHRSVTFKFAGVRTPRKFQAMSPPAFKWLYLWSVWVPCAFGFALTRTGSSFDLEVDVTTFLIFLWKFRGWVPAFKSSLNSDCGLTKHKTTSCKLFEFESSALVSWCCRLGWSQRISKYYSMINVGNKSQEEKQTRPGRSIAIISSHSVVIKH